MESLGQPVKEEKVNTADTANADESGAKPPQRRKSKLNVLTSFFSHTSSSGSTKTLSASAADAPRPKTAHEVLPASHIREKPTLRNPIASTLGFSNKSSSEDSPDTSSNPHDSISNVDNSPGVLIPTPATQVSDFDFGLMRTESPEATDNPNEAQTGSDMPAVIRKHQRGSSATDGPPQYAPPVPPKEPVPQGIKDPEITMTPLSPEMPSSRGSERRSSSAQPPPQNDRKNGPTKLQPARRPSSPATAPRARSSSANPPSGRASTGDHTRTVSSPLDPRPTSKHSNEGDGRGRLRRSWLPGGRSRSASKDLKKMSADKAWIISADSQADYNTAFLMNADKVMVPCAAKQD